MSQQPIQEQSSLNNNPEVELGLDSPLYFSVDSNMEGHLNGMSYIELNPLQMGFPGREISVQDNNLSQLGIPSGEPTFFYSIYTPPSPYFPAGTQYFYTFPNPQVTICPDYQIFVPLDQTTPPCTSLGLTHCEQNTCYNPANYSSEEKDELIQGYQCLEREFYCPINLQLLENPVVLTVCGHTFSRTSIFQWLGYHRKCPLCKVPVTSADIKPNYQLENIMEAYMRVKRRNIEKHPSND